MDNKGPSQEEVDDGCSAALNRYLAVDEATADQMLAFELAGYIAQCGYRGLSVKDALAKLGLFWMRLVEETEQRGKANGQKA